MPSASNVKVDKQANSENASLPESSANTMTPLRQVITLIEHKIRNLEKRKSKLESYRDLQSQGKELNADQKTAVAKFSEVTHTLDFARDIYKQFVSITVLSEKEEKKKAKREAAAKNQAELARLREILLVQDALNQMGNESVRDDFLHGRNGAAQLTETELKLLDDLYPAVTPKHEAGNPTAFTNEVQAAAEHLLAVVDGKQKEVFGGTYSQVKEVLGKIHESGYFDQVQVFEEYDEATEQIDAGEPLVTQVIEHSSQQQLPPIDQLTMDDLPPQPQQVVPQPILEQSSLPPAEQQIFYQQPPRPISEMLGTGSFYFLQESEIDTPDQIPTQTFTNQNYVNAPPPPIPLPPMFQPQQQQPSQQQPPPPPPPAQQQQIPPQHQQPPPAPLNLGGPVQNPSVHPTNNTYKINEGKGDDMHKPIRQRSAPNNQSYYQNNNGYNSRSKQQRNSGSRNRH